jgi:hypothetical protein
MSMKDEINFPIVSYPFVCINIPVTPPYGYLIFQYRRVFKYQRGNPNPYIERYIGTYRLEFLLCTLTPEVQCATFHRNHVI